MRPHLLTIRVQYCGGWGEKKFMIFEDAVFFDVYYYSVASLSLSWIHHLYTHLSLIEGYRPYYVRLRNYLKQVFGDIIVVQEQMDRGITGNFEVTILNTNTLIHTKRQGKAESARERQLIVDQIKEALESL